MYTLIIKTLPEFLSALSDEQVFRTFAPPQLKNAVSDLFQQLEIQVRIAGRKTTGEKEQKRESMSMAQ